MTDTVQPPSARRDELLERAYRYVLRHGLVDMSLRPLAESVGSSPRVLLFLFGSKQNLVLALLARARREELALLDAIRRDAAPADLTAAGAALWQWLSAPEHADLLRLWLEGYARSLVDPTGAWSRFAERTVHDWLAVLAQFQPAPFRNSVAARTERTAVLAVLRGALIDLLATGERARTGAAVREQLRALALHRPAAE